MAKDSPSRSLDRFIIRLPDGMREKLAGRAAANGRSMNAEVVAILEAALEEVSFSSLEALVEELFRLNRQDKNLSATIREIQTRRTAVMRQLHAMASSELVQPEASEEVKEKAKIVIASINRALRDTPPGPS